MDENNHYVNAIKNPSVCEFNVILNNLMLKMKTKTKTYLMKCMCQYLKKAS